MTPITASEGWSGNLLQSLNQTVLFHCWRYLRLFQSITSLSHHQLLKKFPELSFRSSLLDFLDNRCCLRFVASAHWIRWLIDENAYKIKMQHHSCNTRSVDLKQYASFGCAVGLSCKMQRNQSWMQRLFSSFTRSKWCKQQLHRCTVISQHLHSLCSLSPKMGRWSRLNIWIHPMAFASQPLSLWNWHRCKRLQPFSFLDDVFEVLDSILVAFLFRILLGNHFALPKILSWHDSTSPHLTCVLLLIVRSGTMHRGSCVTNCQVARLPLPRNLQGNFPPRRLDNEKPWARTSVRTSYYTWLYT